MSIPKPIEKFIKWIQAFEYCLLQNEDDVETKFILPMFQYLGYAHGYRRGKYPLKTYSPGRQGRKPEADQVYFATENTDEQNADTSLILVEAKEPQENNLDNAIEQAKFYSAYIEPIFFIVTNGYKIKVIKRHRGRGEESVFDITIDSLKDTVIASKFYNQINFEVVKRINEEIANPLTYAKYVLLEQSLQRHPDLQDILDKGDFKTSKIREVNRLSVTMPKVLITCKLPKYFGKGECEVQFSSIMLRGLTINLTHQDILGTLMTGLNTQPNWGCRRFLGKLDKNTFEAYLGQTTVILSELEAVELCICIDEICKEYKNEIIELENTLETGNFEFVEFEGIRGFHLFSVDHKLWELMHQFSDEFDYGKGNSEWHIFHQQNMSIRVGNQFNDHAFIWPKASISYWDLLPNRQIDVIYQLADFHFKSIEGWKVNYWKEDVGTRGTWTAIYTKKWLLEQYIPKVIDYYGYYPQQFQLSKFELLPDITDYTDYKFKRVSIKNIDEIIQLSSYLHDIQSWFHSYGINIAASLLRSYYRAFTDLVRNTDPSIIGMDYIRGNLSSLERENTRQKIDSNSTHWTNWTFKRAIDCLDEQAAIINNCECENSFKADLISRTFIWIIENGKICFSQAQLNAAKEALLPLWKQSRFEQRHIYPNQSPL